MTKTTNTLNSDQSHDRSEQNSPTKIIIVGSGVAGSEAGTNLGYKTKKPIDIVEVECEPDRRFGGWGFQGFPNGVTTNLAIRKMYLGDQPEEILNWANDPEQRKLWPAEIQNFQIDPDKPFPRPLVQMYVKWRRAQVDNTLANYSKVTGEAIKVQLTEKGVAVKLRSGESLEGDKLIMASGSISVKVPEYLETLQNHDRVIIDPLTREGHERRKEISQNGRVLILGTGLTGEEQAILLLNRGLSNLTLHSRNGQRHYSYPEKQKNIPLILEKAPEFFIASTPEEFDNGLRDFYKAFLGKGYSPEDILNSLRPFWNDTRKQLGGCVKAANRLRESRRILAVNSIGTTFEVESKLRAAESANQLKVQYGNIISVNPTGNNLKVTFQDGENGQREEEFDWIINAIGRNIIRHPIWENMLEEGLAKKHAGIGVRVSEKGQMMNAQGEASNRIWVVGMARAGDHALRHGYLGNFAFNVPQVRTHVKNTILALLESI